jgi:GNAT superfamily N-acetyltransferase
VLTAADEDCYHTIMAAAFGVVPDLATQFVPASSYVGDPDIALFLGTCDGVDVAGTGCSRSGSTAVVWGVATLEAYRGRGFGATLIGAALTHAAAIGCTSASLRSGPKSVPLYERVGFRYVCQHRTYAAPSD